MWKQCKLVFCMYMYVGWRSTQAILNIIIQVSVIVLVMRRRNQYSLAIMKYPLPFHKKKLSLYCNSYNVQHNMTVKGILTVMKQLKQLQRKHRKNSEAWTGFEPMTSTKRVMKSEIICTWYGSYTCTADREYSLLVKVILAVTDYEAIK